MTTDSAKIIPLTRDEFTIVDADDYERLSKYKWFYKVGGTGGDGYAARSHRVNGKVCTVRMHREIVNAPPHMEVDHVDGDTLNNRKYNLRVTTKQENLKNRRYDKVSA